MHSIHTEQLIYDPGLIYTFYEKFKKKLSSEIVTILLKSHHIDVNYDALVVFNKLKILYEIKAAFLHNRLNDQRVRYS